MDPAIYSPDPDRLGQAELGARSGMVPGSGDQARRARRARGPAPGELEPVVVRAGTTAESLSGYLSC